MKRVTTLLALAVAASAHYEPHTCVHDKLHHGSNAVQPALRGARQLYSSETPAGR